MKITPTPHVFLTKASRVMSKLHNQPFFHCPSPLNQSCTCKHGGHCMGYLFLVLCNLFGHRTSVCCSISILSTTTRSANTNNSSSHCEWPGMTCNAAGSVIEIVIGFGHFYLGEMSKLNLSSFPNLVRLDLPRTRL
jgi:hypothetical protein